MRPTLRLLLIAGGAVLAVALVGLLAFNTYAILTEEGSLRRSEPAPGSPVAPEAQATPTCPARQVYMPRLGRCVPAALSCAPTERYDTLRERCVPKAIESAPLPPTLPRPVPTIERIPSQPICGFGEYYDTLEERCVVGRWSCTSAEEYDVLRKRCVPKAER